MKKDQKGTDDNQRRRQDLMRGHETRRRLRRPRPLSDLWEANPALAPKLRTSSLLGLRSWTHWRLLFSKPHETPPIILGLRTADMDTALYHNAEGVAPKASRGRKTGTVYRTRSQSTSGSEGAPSAPLAGLELENDFIAF